VIAKIAYISSFLHFHSPVSKSGYRIPDQRTRFKTFLIRNPDGYSSVSGSALVSMRILFQQFTVLPMRIRIRDSQLMWVYANPYDSKHLATVTSSVIFVVCHFLLFVPSSAVLLLPVGCIARIGQCNRRNGNQQKVPATTVV
jgi:hypothetical protein